MKIVNQVDYVVEMKKKQPHRLLTPHIARRVGASLLCVVALATATSSSSVNARANSGNVHTNSVRPQSGACGVRVYMTASGASGQDGTNDTATKTSLETGTNLCITIGVEYTALATVAGSVTSANYDVIYLQGQNNWYTADLNAFQADDFAVIDSFLTAGGGVVVGEWLAWDACSKSYTGAWNSLDTIMPAKIRSGCSYGSNMKVRFYRWDRPTTAALDTGVTSDFIFQPADYAGSLSYMTLKAGATGYYWARWNSNVANIPAAVDPSGMPSDGGVGMAGWVPTGKTGRVFSFATTNGAPELADTSASNSFRRLLVNALGWTGSVGGAVTPDAVSTTGSAGSSISTPPLSPSKINGTVTYSIASGTLPDGLTLNTSTGSITGTPTYGANVNVTIQAVGSISGTAQAVVAFSISGPAAPAPATPPASGATTTTSVAPTTSTTSTTTSTTVATANLAASGAKAVPTPVVSNTKAAKLPSSGTRPDLLMLSLILLLVGGFVLSAKKRLHRQ